ncbi:hypothetical protein V8F20_004632 [Naviculisporaceae sp. PSN 640]
MALTIARKKVKKTPKTKGRIEVPGKLLLLLCHLLFLIPLFTRYLGTVRSLTRYLFCKAGPIISASLVGYSRRPGHLTSLTLTLGELFSPLTLAAATFPMRGWAGLFSLCQTCLGLTSGMSMNHRQPYFLIMDVLGGRVKPSISTSPETTHLAQRLCVLQNQHKKSNGSLVVSQLQHIQGRFLSSIASSASRLTLVMTTPLGGSAGGCRRCRGGSPNHLRAAVSLEVSSPLLARSCVVGTGTLAKGAAGDEAAGTDLIVLGPATGARTESSSGKESKTIGHSSRFAIIISSKEALKSKGILSVKLKVSQLSRMSVCLSTVVVCLNKFQNHPSREMGSL